MTDSLNAAHIARPESLRYHKHSQLITDFSQKLFDMALAHQPDQSQLPPKRYRQPRSGWIGCGCAY